LNFDAHATDPTTGERRPIASNWGGVAGLGNYLTYALADYEGGRSEKRYELRLRFGIARGEIVY
jgi:hypothetical protein